MNSLTPEKLWVQNHQDLDSMNPHEFIQESHSTITYSFGSFGKISELIPN